MGNQISVIVDRLNDKFKVFKPDYNGPKKISRIKKVAASKSIEEQESDWEESLSGIDSGYGSRNYYILNEIDDAFLLTPR